MTAAGRGGRIAAAVVLAVVLASLSPWTSRVMGDAGWSERQLELIDSLWIGHLPPPPPDPGNAVADDAGAAELGHRLFFDPRLSASGGIACATCHRPERRFADTFPKSVGIGPTRRNTPSLVGAAWSPWQYWDGRKDSLWSQALAPLEHPDEQGIGRDGVAALIAGDRWYRNRYVDLFGAEPSEHDVERVFANVGKALAAYERKLAPGPSRFDRYVAGLRTGQAPSDALTADERAGLALFIDDAGCIDCHNGPLFTNHAFHNTGQLSAPGELPDRGRFDGLRDVRSDPFNCEGGYGDSGVGTCDELAFALQGPETLGAMRTPSLRNLGGTAPYAHHGQMPDLASVIEHYDEAPEAMLGHNETEPLGLSGREKRQLKAFLEALDAPMATEDRWLVDPFSY